MTQIELMEAIYVPEGESDVFGDSAGEAAATNRKCARLVPSRTSYNTVFSLLQYQ